MELKSDPYASVAMPVAVPVAPPADVPADANPQPRIPTDNLILNGPPRIPTVPVVDAAPHTNKARTIASGLLGALGLGGVVAATLLSLGSLVLGGAGLIAAAGFGVMFWELFKGRNGHG